MLPRARCLSLAFGLLLLVSCFDPPVKESVRLRFFPNGAVAVTNTVELDLLKDRQSNPALERRMEELRRDLLDGVDPWARRFDSIEPVAERLSWEKRLGALATARRSALIAESRSLGDLFADTALSVTYEVGEDGLAELVIVPGVPSQATRRQRKDVERTLDEWTGKIAEYLDATADLYRWLDDNPQRAEACFQALLGDAVEEGSSGAEELSAQERQMVDKVEEAMEQVLLVLLIPDGQDRSPDELSHLVYDPFPAPLSVQFPSDPLEVEGFVASSAEDKVWTVDSPGFWEALRSLEERWIAPDPVLLYVAHREDGDLDLEKLVETPRRVIEPMPDSLEVRRAIEERLAPASQVYRAVWQASPPAQADEEEFSWEGD
ncbi:MAG TPA: hypothetical protein VN493_01860 [Thermoanaerobaculia bacterium]|nr:hypothetical protein [Thermoanaerobaculia bacterium]